MSTPRINRRRFLRNSLTGAATIIGMPLLQWHMDAMPKAMASEGLFPKRFGMFLWGNGVIPQAWVPENTGRDYTPSYLLEPLQSVKDLVTVITGTEVKVPNVEPHFSGQAGILTGSPLLMKADGGHTMPTATIDQQIAQVIGGDTRFRSIEFGARAQRPMSYNGPDNPNPVEASPFALYERIFGAEFREPGDDSEPDPRIALRRSVLDSVTADVARFNQRLGAADRIRLDQHLTSVREIENRLARLAETPANLAACQRPDLPEDEFPDIGGRPQIQELNRALVDICALAMACDQTRVISNIITTPTNNLLLAQITAGHHQLTHDEPGDQPMVQSVVRQMMEEYAYMVQAFQNIPEGDGTLLDSCVLLGTTEISYGRTHGLDEFPILYAGSGGGRLLQGSHIRSEVSDNSSQVILSMKRALGINAASHGTESSYTESGFSPMEV
jgi:hypothetical protein